MVNVSPHFVVIIPARFASTRLPGKALIEIAGKTLTQRVYERAVQSNAERVIVATDDERVASVARGFGAEVFMTSSAHRSGTERIAEVVKQIGLGPGNIVVNVQGDEPLLPAENIDQVARNLHARPGLHIATLSELILSDEALFDPNVVKVVTARNGEALYFSRAPIPWHRDHLQQHPGTRAAGGHFWRHVGIYAYRADYLMEYASADATALEEAEALEQLRALENGARIHVEEAHLPPGPGVDTPADLSLVRQLLGEQ